MIVSFDLKERKKKKVFVGSLFELGGEEKNGEGEEMTRRWGDFLSGFLFLLEIIELCET